MPCAWALENIWRVGSANTILWPIVLILPLGLELMGGIVKPEQVSIKFFLSQSHWLVHYPQFDYFHEVWMPSAFSKTYVNQLYNSLLSLKNLLGLEGAVTVTVRDQH